MIKKLLLAFFGMYPAPKNIGVPLGDYNGFIESYRQRIDFGRPLTIKHEIELINLQELDNPHAPLTAKHCHELINLKNLEELLDPRDPRFRTRQFIDMRGWKSRKVV